MRHFLKEVHLLKVFHSLQEGTNTRVMGSAKNALATKVVTRKDLTWVIPDSWSLAEAATVPTAYMTAYYALVMRGKLRKGMRVLIHSGTGAVGLAAVQICLHRGAEVGAPLSGCSSCSSQSQTAAAACTCTADAHRLLGPLLHQAIAVTL